MYILPFQEISWKGKTAFRSAPRSIIIFIITKFIASNKFLP